MIAATLLAMAQEVSGAAAPPAPRDYSIAAIEYVPGPLARAGSLKAGYLCLPKGKLRWRDIARPEDDVTLRRLSALLANAGLSVTPPPNLLFGDLPPATRYRLRIVVQDVAMKLCVAGLGLGEKQPSGGGTMTVRWDVFDREARERVDTRSYTVPLMLAGRDPRSASSVFSDALSASAAEFARDKR